MRVEDRKLYEEKRRRNIKGKEGVRENRKEKLRQNEKQSESHVE